ncbi:hypothetical protein [Sphingomonas sp. UV9]|uniref:hypothetical protein n=1 Tax=Sphingomonas sp. UV9 TaxID=1851410 RepID=UPI003204719B
MFFAIGYGAAGKEQGRSFTKAKGAYDAWHRSVPNISIEQALDVWQRGARWIAWHFSDDDVARLYA